MFCPRNEAKGFVHDTTVPEAVPQPDTILRYNNVAVAIHWTTVVLLLTQVYVGFTFYGMEPGPERGEWFTWHKTIGATTLLLSLIRLAWRLAHTPPPFPINLPRWESIAPVCNPRHFHFLAIVPPPPGRLHGRGCPDAAPTN